MDAIRKDRESAAIHLLEHPTEWTTGEVNHTYRTTYYGIECDTYNANGHTVAITYTPKIFGDGLKNILIWKYENDRWNNYPLNPAEQRLYEKALLKREVLIKEFNKRKLESLDNDYLICTNEVLKKELDRLIEAAPGVALTSDLKYIRERAQKQ